MTARWTIVGLGEILWDIFPDGEKFGGAPANFACSAAGYGAQYVDVHVVSGVGQDELGRAAIKTLGEKQVSTSAIQENQHPTGTVLVTIDEAGSASYEFRDNTAWDNLQTNLESTSLAHRADAVCFGTLGQRSKVSREAIQQFVTSMRPDALKVYDVNLRPPHVNHDVLRWSLETANVLKMNEDELPFVAEMLGLAGNERTVLQTLASRFKLRCAALTRGSRGSILVGQNEFDENTGVNTDVLDTVGAGDAFSAVLTIGLLAAQPLISINRAANQLAAFVCRHAGATPEIDVQFEL